MPLERRLVRSDVSDHIRRLLVVCLFTLAVGQAARASSQTGRSGERRIAEQQRLKAIAFLLGWDAKTILLQSSEADKKRLLGDMQMYLETLQIKMPHPLAYYFDPGDRSGTRAQAFAEEVHAELTMSDSNIANHFTVATNVLLSLAHMDEPGSRWKAEIEDQLSELELPPELRHVPDRDALTWALRLQGYYESILK